MHICDIFVVIVCGRSLLKISKSISKILNIPLVQASIKKFNDQELRVQIPLSLRDQKAIIVGSISTPSNNCVMEFLLLVDAIKKAGAKEIIAVIPYLGYARQDRSFYEYGPISIDLVARLLKTSGVDGIITLDLHAPHIKDFFSIHMLDLDTTSLLLPFMKNIKNYVIVSPDKGGVKRAQKFCDYLQTDFVTIQKSRNQDNKCHMNQMTGGVLGKNCIIIDDILDTGQTLYNACKLLLKMGAKSIYAFITHAVLSKNAISLIENSPIEKVYVTNSICHKKLCHKMQVVLIDQLLAKAISDFESKKS